MFNTGKDAKQHNVNVYKFFRLFAYKMIFDLKFAVAFVLIPMLMFLMAVFSASVYGGSISAILINIPGTAAAAATAQAPLMQCRQRACLRICAADPARTD